MRMTDKRTRTSQSLPESLAFLMNGVVHSLEFIIYLSEFADNGSLHILPRSHDGQRILLMSNSRLTSTAIYTIKLMEA